MLLEESTGGGGGRGTRKEERGQGLAFGTHRAFFVSKTCSPTTRLLHQPDRLIKPFPAGLLRALNPLRHAGGSWEKPLLTTGSPFQEAPYRPRVLRSLCASFVAGCVHSSSQDLGGEPSASPGGKDFNSQRREAPCPMCQ